MDLHSRSTRVSFKVSVQSADSRAGQMTKKEEEEKKKEKSTQPSKQRFKHAGVIASVVKCNSIDSTLLWEEGARLGFVRESNRWME
ncbi:hypothetical protein IAQ61_003541 [Plenodomus lingam]|uniref:Predicted protein n=1 Tax=Leptosphaeria maculans (strain JN3 / isolate v23.1.3 / race Av1-4-5-6-7-8) TaxID=985895 RepID=E4ZQY6_LEPMJ|nr:predicted protein [Plenodomus lingam JN3]KAH9874352.1 hypothetical protein IAQ61_003541 [Plenodomus lingam]CBX93651.1 predicted protein [Plenodomus lingam JN3]